MGCLVALVLAACLIAVGCTSGPTSVEADTATSGVDSTSSQDSAPDDAEPSGASSELINPTPGGDDLVVCAGTQFPLSALRTLEPMTSRPEIEAAVNSFLQGGEGNFWPQDGWQVLTISETKAFVIVLQTETQARQNAEDRELEVFFDDGFGDGIDDSILFSANNVERMDGSWRWAGSVSGEDCLLESVVPEGLNRVEWELDPESLAPAADSNSLKLLATERECVGGQPMGDRLLPVEVVETDATVLIAMAATQPPGNEFTCPGNPAQSITVELSSPLGDRNLLDGATTAGRLSDHVGDVFGLSSLDG